MYYCVTCRKKTKDKDVKIRVMRNGRRIRRSICTACGKRKCTFLSGQKGGKVDIHNLIGKLPRPKGGWTLPKHKYTGPYNPLDYQLDANDRPLPGQEPYNQVDEIAMRHDICYRDNIDDKHGCDRKMLDELNEMKPNGLRERIDRRFVKTVIGAKYKLGI